MSLLETFKEILLVLWIMWPIWLFFIGVFVILLFIKVIIPNAFRRLISSIRFRRSKQWHSDKVLLSYLKNITPNEFEEYVASMFEVLGYKTKVVGKAHDGGIDVVAEKDGIKYYIQCKKYVNKKVNVHDVRDFVGALAGKLADGKGYFITTNVFTLDALKYSEDQPIELINGYKLVEYIRMAQDKGWNPEMLDKQCPECGESLLKRNSKFGEFYGCSNYPKCKYTEDIK